MHAPPREMAIPAYLRLYKHALESIFSHLNLSELARISATCRGWSAAVDSMRPIGASVGGMTSLGVQSMCTSRLVRHVFEMNLSMTKFDLSSLSSFCETIKQNKSLVVVHLYHNGLRGVDVSAIADAIKQSTSLTTMSLSCNEIGDAGAIAIAGAIKQSKSLTKVGLICNAISVEGASAIVDSIKQSKSLAEVNLAGNQIGFEGVQLASGKSRTPRHFFIFLEEPNFFCSGENKFLEYEASRRLA